MKAINSLKFFLAALTLSLLMGLTDMVAQTSTSQAAFAAFFTN